MSAKSALWLFACIVVTLPWLVQDQTSAPVLWWAARSFGFVAYTSLWLAMLTGLLISNRRLGGRLDRKVLFELHQQWALSGVIATILHVLAITTHAESRIGLVGGVVPYMSERLSGPVALGTLAFWGIAVLSATSWLRSHISYRAWRAIHTLAFGTFLLALTHAATTGTDASYLIVRWFYVVTASVLTAGIAFRIAATVGRPRSRDCRTAVVTPESQQSGLDFGAMTSAMATTRRNHSS